MTTWVEYGGRIDGDGDRKPDIIAAYATTTALAVTAVILRFLARKLAGAKLWYDDWLMLGGMVISLAFTATIMYWVSIGLGRFIGLVTPATLADSYEVIFASELIYIFAIGTVKMSLIAFYWRILGHTRRLRLALWIFSGVNVAWVVALFFTVLFQCVPVRGFWDKTIEMQCGVDLKSMLIGNMIPTFLTDVALVCLPLFYIPPRVNTTSLQKIILYIIFFLGFFVTVAPIVRLHILAKLDPHSRNVTWDFVNYVIWTGAEVNVAIVAGCLPSLKPVLRKLVPTAFVPSRLRDTGRKDWIVASPDQSWLKEPVSVDSSLRRSGGVLDGRTSSQVELVGDVAMADLTPQQSNSSDDEHKHKPVMTVHEV